MRILSNGKSQKGIFPIIIRAESVKVTQLKETGSVIATPFKGTESVYNVSFCNIESYQPLYLKEIFT